TTTGWPSPRGANERRGNAPRKAPSSWMARPSRNISVLDGGRSVCAAADILSPVQAGPLRRGSRQWISVGNANLVDSFRNATKQTIPKSYGTAPGYSSEPGRAHSNKRPGRDELVTRA